LEKFILVINPGSTSTKVALFRALENEVEVAVEENVSVPVDLLEQKPHYVDQIDSDYSRYWSSLTNTVLHLTKYFASHPVVVHKTIACWNL